MEESLGQEKIVLCYLFIDSVATGLPLTQSLVLIGVCGGIQLFFQLLRAVPQANRDPRVEQLERQKSN
jgi:hypothetical protein